MPCLSEADDRAAFRMNFNDERETMTEMANGNNGAPPPHAQLIQMGMGFIPARVLYVAAKLGLADLLADEPKSAAELAGPTKTHARSLHRLMRTLSSLGVLTEGVGGRFELTEMGEALRTGAPGSARSSILSFGGWAWNSFKEMSYSVETGQSAFTHFNKFLDHRNVIQPYVVGMGGSIRGGRNLAFARM
jgi:Dimerisation domain